jgi:hypothetical protein
MPLIGALVVAVVVVEVVAATAACTLVAMVFAPCLIMMIVGLFLHAAA